MLIRYRENVIDVTDGTTYLDLAERFKNNYGHRIILAKVEQNLTELYKEVSPTGLYITEEGKIPELEFITVNDPDGLKTYERGATMMFIKAAEEVINDGSVSVKVEYKIADGLYFTFYKKYGGEFHVTKELAGKIQSKMEEYVSSDIKFVKKKLHTMDAVADFRRRDMKDKEHLLHYRRSSSTNMYSLGDYSDYYYGYMPPSTSYIKYFRVKTAKNGLLLIIPGIMEPDRPGRDDFPAKLFEVMNKTNIWGENIGVPTVAALNDAICAGKGHEIILASEAYQEHNIGEIAKQIKKENRRVILIAGPSSSGKTSFSHRLSVQLHNTGLLAHPISCDNYYLERSRTPKDENGEYDFERLDALDVDLFNSQMTDLLKGVQVDLPTFNFRTGKPEFKGNILKLGKDEVLVIEGIHGLNEGLSGDISPEDKFKVYISAVTALNVDEHNRIPTTDTREIRRMVRDNRTRGFTAKDTISRWASVRAGEEKHIFPFQEDADVMFNSSTLYELAVLKTFAEPLLFAIPTDAKEYPEAKRLLKFLEYFLGLSCEDVPRNSLVREFIGGSIFPVG